METRTRYQGGQALHDNMGGAIFERTLQFQHNIAGAVTFEPFNGDRRASDIPAEMLQFLALIGAPAHCRASLQTYDYLGRALGQTVAARGEEFQLSASSGVAVSVEDSLDQEELADIQELFDTLSKVSNDFFAGNSQADLQNLAELDDFGSIASFEASFNYSRQISSVAASQISSRAAAPAQETPGASVAAPANGSQAAGSFIDQLRRVAEQLNSDNNFAKIPKRFAQLFNKFAHQLALDTHEEKLAYRIRSEYSRHDRHSDGQTQITS